LLIVLDASNTALGQRSSMDYLVRNSAEYRTRSSLEEARPTLTEPRQGQFLKEDEYTTTNIGGRDYITESAYILSTDELEKMRLDEQHYLFKRHFGGRNCLCNPKTERVKAILEIGFGSGIWAIALTL
jgi:hypothetical protein